MPTLLLTDIEARSPDLDELAERTSAWCTRIAAAHDVAALEGVLGEWDEARAAVETWDAWVYVTFSQDTRDAEARARREAWDAAQPRWTELMVEVKRALLEHPLRAELAGRVGAQAFSLWELEVLAFDPRIKDDLAQESRLTAAYIELLASARIPFQGETHNLSALAKFRQDPEREVRLGSERAHWDWFAQQGAELDRLFDELVALRHGMARSLGLADYVELGYRRMARIDYGRADVERFRERVLEEVVPLCAELRARQAEALGLERLMAWDEPLLEPDGNPRPLGDHDRCVAAAQEAFDSMGHGLGEFFRDMREGGFLDLEIRPGKAGGGFCTAFPTHRMPFVFSNFNGTKGDVEVLTHEMGHAFQSHASQGLRPLDYIWATYESCEVHSMSLEFLCWPHLDAFFGAEQAQRFRRMHLIEGLCFLPYGCAVDHFQHEVYGRPSMTPEERHATWLATARRYLPWQDWGELAYPARGGRWQSQRHVYRTPFYYIDYVLAQTCALQFWAWAERDRSAATEAWVALCHRGGSAPFQELVRSAGLTSPFAEGCLGDVLDRARAYLEL